MYSPPAQLHRSHRDAPKGLGNTLFHAAEGLTSRNLAAPRALAQDAGEIARNLFRRHSTLKAVATGSGRVQPAAEKLVSPSRSIHSIGHGANAEAAKIAQTVSPFMQFS